ncbi:MAG: flagellar biosynthesis protein [Pseudotabrizicola sp.]|uniref:FliH/SctL family protein n=1 Tax=Pseudotabrizicola sp. TaxID=2939647 RepID=UPI0027273A7D|nr:flagellar biosynthesis protein [Pseudotabrizicola sp.]MDO8882511.1 flagellar biosynthesis protein [Pseudotabrizicola sp.]MDP2082088.1 flagellar biosynthesis protein [Pseudotabrizicola sp.]MDZ7576481.1 flagellar biosynthesis protein [Pseudotabrizicola sp.]
MPPLKLEVFEAPSRQGGDQTVVMDGAAIEEARLQSYETGYAAGWEDATVASQDEQTRIGSELANNLQQMAFTFQEARTHVLKSIQPVLTQLCTQLLPPLAQGVLAPVVLETIMPLIDDLAETPVHVVLNPAARPAVERLLSQAAGLPLVIVEEPTLGEGQVYLRLGDVEHRVDLDHAVAALTTAVHDFFEYSEKDGADG